MIQIEVGDQGFEFVIRKFRSRLRKDGVLSEISYRLANPNKTNRDRAKARRAMLRKRKTDRKRQAWMKKKEVRHAN